MSWLSSRFNFLILVSVLIAGGSNSNTSELFLPSTGTSCTLPAFPEARYYHTLDNNILCGGYLTETRTSCIQLSPDDGTWKQLLTLDLERRAHLSWTPESGIGTYLMGGHIIHYTRLIPTPPQYLVAFSSLVNCQSSILFESRVHFFWKIYSQFISTYKINNEIFSSPLVDLWVRLRDLRVRLHLHIFLGALPPTTTFTNTTTLIKPDGTQEPGFSLKYDTAWVLNALRFFFHYVTLCFMSAMPAPSLTPIQPQ